MQDADELPVIIFLLKDELTVDASEHHVVDACLAVISRASWHVALEYCWSIVIFASAKLARIFIFAILFLNKFSGLVLILRASVFRHLYAEIVSKEFFKGCPLRFEK